MITCPGEQMHARVGASLLTAAGLPELICPDREAYRALALALYRDQSRLAGLKQRLRSGFGRTPLFDCARTVAHLERALETMWRRHCAGQAPTAFDVTPANPLRAAPRWF